MAEAVGSGWHPARLIPTSGINGQDEAERRATSALLAVMSSVREFGAAIIRPLGAPAGQLSAFIEAPFRLGDGTVIPDGVLQTTRAGRTWTVLVEVKTGAAQLERAQVESYLDVARDQGFDGVLTISNQIAPAPAMHPVEVDRRKTKRVRLHHLSWAEVLTVAMQQRIHRGVADPDQAWVLGELIRYLEHPKSGAVDFNDMGASWVDIRESVAAGTLRINDKGLLDVVARWYQLMRFAALKLSRELGTDVEVIASRRDLAEPATMLSNQAHSVVANGVLSSALRIPGTIGSLHVTADLRAGRMTVSVEADAPREGRPTTRVNWLVRQLREAPDLRVDAFHLGTRSSTSALLSAVRETPEILVDPARELRGFKVAAGSSLGTKRGTGRGSFIDSVLTAIGGFYEGVLQTLRPWAVRAPQLPKAGRTAAEEAGLDIAPPPRDLLDEPSIEVPPVEVVDPCVVLSDQVEMLEEQGGEEEPLVSWPNAQERLDHERALAAPQNGAA